MTEVPGTEKRLEPSLLSRMRARLDRHWSGVASALRCLLGGLFIYSAWHKILDPVSFMVKVQEYDFPPAEWLLSHDLNPDRWIEPFADVLPWVMVVAGVLLIVGFASRPAAATLAAMLVMFLIAISANIYRQRVLGCGCFSEEGHQIGALLLFQDLGLLILSSLLVWKGGGRYSLDGLIWRFLKKENSSADQE